MDKRKETGGEGSRHEGHDFPSSLSGSFQQMKKGSPSLECDFSVIGNL